MGAVTKQSWESSAAGTIPLVVAATTANIAYQIARDLEKDLKEYGIHDPDDLSSRYSSCLDSLNLSNHFSTAGNSQFRPDFTLFSDDKGPQEGWLALKHFRDVWQYGTASEELSRPSSSRDSQDKRLSTFALDDPASLFSVSSDDATQRENLRRTNRSCMDLILTRMGQLLILSRSNPSAYIPFHTPLLDELAGFLGINEKPSDKGSLLGHPPVTATDPRPLSLSFGLQMVVESYKSFGFSKRNEPQDDQQCALCEVRRSCRVQSLQFAADVGFRIE